MRFLEMSASWISFLIFIRYVEQSRGGDKTSLFPPPPFLLFLLFFWAAEGGEDAEENKVRELGIFIRFQV